MWTRSPKTHRLVRQSTMAEEREHNNGEGAGRIITPPRLSLKQMLMPTRSSTASCLVPPADSATFNFKPGVINLLPTFHGLERENPYTHIREFEDVCATCRDGKTSNETIHLNLFPFSLKDRAKVWLNSLPPNSITTWLDLQAEFLTKFFPLHRTQALQKQISNFAQKPNESFYQVWERFKELLRACPHHGFEMCRTIGFFYDGLTQSSRQFLQMMCNGEFYDKEPEEAYDYLEFVAESAQNWDTSSEQHFDRSEPLPQTSSSKGSGMLTLKPEDALEAKMEALLNKKLQSLELKSAKAVAVENACVICDSSEHPTNVCPGLPMLKGVIREPEEVNAVGANNYPGYTYQSHNPAWRNHPNFSWKNQSQPPQNQPPPPPTTFPPKSKFL